VIVSEGEPSMHECPRHIRWCVFPWQARKPTAVRHLPSAFVDSFPVRGRPAGKPVLRLSTVHHLPSIIPIRGCVAKLRI